MLLTADGSGKGSCLPAEHPGASRRFAAVGCDCCATYCSPGTYPHSKAEGWLSQW